MSLIHDFFWEIYFVVTSEGRNCYFKFVIKDVSLVKKSFFFAIQFYGKGCVILLRHGKFSV